MHIQTDAENIWDICFLFILFTVDWVVCKYSDCLHVITWVANSLCLVCWNSSLYRLQNYPWYSSDVYLKNVSGYFLHLFLQKLHMAEPKFIQKFYLRFFVKRLALLKYWAKDLRTTTLRSARSACTSVSYFNSVGSRQNIFASNISRNFAIDISRNLTWIFCKEIYNNFLCSYFSFYLQSLFKILSILRNRCSHLNEFCWKSHHTSANNNLLKLKYRTENIDMLLHQE